MYDLRVCVVLVRVFVVCGVLVRNVCPVVMCVTVESLFLMYDSSVRNV